MTAMGDVEVDRPTYPMSDQLAVYAERWHYTPERRYQNRAGDEPLTAKQAGYIDALAERWPQAWVELAALIDAWPDCHAGAHWFQRGWTKSDGMFIINAFHQLERDVEIALAALKRASPSLTPEEQDEVIAAAVGVVAEADEAAESAVAEAAEAVAVAERAVALAKLRVRKAQLEVQTEEAVLRLMGRWPGSTLGESLAALEAYVP